MEQNRRGMHINISKSATFWRMEARSDIHLRPSWFDRLTMSRYLGLAHGSSWTGLILSLSKDEPVEG